MWKTVARRLLILIPQLLALSVLIFVLAEFLPGDALSGLIGDDPDITLERVEELRIIHGLDGPWYVRYGRWMRNISRGDFGVSMFFHMPVTQVVFSVMPNTIFLSLFTVILIYAISLPLGIIAGKYNGSWKERIISYYVFFGMALPTVVFAFLLIWALGAVAGWFPLSGTMSAQAVRDGGWTLFWNRIHHMLLPAMSIGLTGSVGITQFLRSEIQEAKVSDYVLTARSKGVPVHIIYNKHILRNSVLPICNGFGGIIMGLLSGTVIIERVFNFNGMGRLFLDSIGRRDYSVAFFLFMFYGVTGVLSVLISDIALTVFDPRIRIK
jgi:peptide/nickel transport system permease protein